jgi:hypothetical protein
MSLRSYLRAAYPCYFEGDGRRDAGSKFSMAVCFLSVIRATAWSGALEMAQPRLVSAYRVLITLDCSSWDQLVLVPLSLAWWHSFIGTPDHTGEWDDCKATTIIIARY